MSTLFTTNELIELRNALKRDGMIPVDAIYLHSGLDFDGTIITRISFCRANTLKLYVIRSKYIYGVEATEQLRKYFIKHKRSMI